METSTAYAIHRLNIEMDRVAENTLQKQVGISYSRFYFLLLLQENKNATQHALGLALGISDAAISTAANRAAREGLAIVTIDPAHGRRRNVNLTKKGEVVLQNCLYALDECFKKVVAEANINEVTYRADTLKLTQTLQTKTKEVS